MNMIYGSGKYSYQLIDDWVELSKDESFFDIGGISIDTQDKVYILSRSKHPIMVFNREGKLVSTWGEGYFKRAHGSYIDSDNFVFCTDDRTHTVTKFDSDGNVLMVLGNKDEPSDTGYREIDDLFERIASITRNGPPFNRPTGVALSQNGDIYVSDGYGNAQVHKFSPEGELLLSWGEPGPESGQFRLPHNIWVDKINRVWVVDRENSRIQIFNEKGKYLTQWRNLLRPTDLFIDDDDVVYVSELCKRISIFTFEGKLLSRWGNESHEVNDPLLVAPHTIAVDSKGDLYVGEVAMTYAKVNRGSKTIRKFTRIK